MSFYRIDPLTDVRWNEFISVNPRASVFYQTGWLKTLADTYGYTPFVLTSSPSGQPLSDGIAFCEVESWITGKRLVSLPFTDHAEPLLSLESRGMLTEWFRLESRQGKWNYIEIRPLMWNASEAEEKAISHVFWLHTLDLCRPTAEIFRGFDKDCVQRRIRRAEREKISVEKGWSKKQLDDFYRLLIGTRRRHHLPPQPRSWFFNLSTNLPDHSELRIARKDGIAVAAIITLSHGSTVVYKYGCSDEQYHHLAPMPLLFWDLILDANARGAERLDFGRTDLDNNGLIRFKDQFGTIRNRLIYYRLSRNGASVTSQPSKKSLAGRIFALMPEGLSCKVGEILYRHMG